MLFTDRKPLVTALSKATTPVSSSQQRHLSFLSEFNLTLAYLPGSANVVADFLSNPSPPVKSSSSNPLPAISAATAPLNLLPISFSYLDMAQEQHQCHTIPLLQKSPSLSITTVPLSPTVSLLGDVSTSTFRSLVPLSFRKQIFDHIHSLGHPGIHAIGE
jgi:hypothetical protein